MHPPAVALIAGLAIFAAAGANAAPSVSSTANHNPNIVQAMAGCKLGFHPAYYGCAPNRYVYRYRPYPRDYIEEWDEYDYY